MECGRTDKREGRRMRYEINMKREVDKWTKQYFISIESFETYLC